MANFSVEEVERLNKLASQKNAERQQLIGKRDAAQQAFNQAVAVYNQKYGVQLTADTLQAEYNKVAKETEESYNALAQMLNDIEEGKYKEVTKTEDKATETAENAEVVPVTAVNVEATGVEEPAVASVQGSVEPQQTPEQVMQQAMGIGFGQSTSVEQNQSVESQRAESVGFGQPVSNAQQFGGFTGFGMPAQAKTDEDVCEQSVAPAGWGSQGASQQFSDILGADGKAVKFQI